MRKCKNYQKKFAALFMALLLGVSLTGCHGSIGWDRMQSSLERQNPTGLDQSRQL